MRMSRIAADADQSIGADGVPLRGRPTERPPADPSTVSRARPERSAYEARAEIGQERLRTGAGRPARPLSPLSLAVSPSRHASSRHGRDDVIVVASGMAFAAAGRGAFDAATNP